MPILQPGTFTFDSGMLEGPHAIMKDGVQQNGALLKMSSSLFFIRFLSKLIQKYQLYCDLEGQDSKGHLNRAVYKKALERTLNLSALEDMEEHGRLMAYKEPLISLLDAQDPLTIKTLGLFQLKDFYAIDEDIAQKLVR